MPPAPIYDLALGRCPVWLQQARALWLSHPLFFLAVSAGVVLLRRGLDAWGMDIFIVVSYLTDAWIFTWLCLGVARGGGGKSWAVSRAGWQAVRGRMFPILKTVGWGIPAALTSYLIFLLVPQGVQALVVVQGNVLGASLMLLVALFAAGFLSMLLGLLPVLAAIQMARDSHATFLSSGLWAYRGIRAGIRPLAGLFILFVFSVVVCNTAATWVMGNLPLAVWSDWTVEEVLNALSRAPLTVFLAMNAFLAILPSMASDLLRSADVDLSDEIFSDAQKAVHGDAFGVRLLDVAGHCQRLAAMLFVVFLVIYAAFSGYEEAGTWLVFAVVAYVWGGSFRKSARARREGQSWSLRWRFVITPVVTILVFVAIGVAYDPQEDAGEGTGSESSADGAKEPGR